MPRSCFLTLLLALCCSRFLLAQEANTANQPVDKSLGEYVSFPGADVKLRQPMGFEKDKTFTGFGLREKLASVMVTVVAGPYKKVSAGFNAEQMTPRGLKLVSKDDIKIGELPGILVHFQQSAGGVDFAKWAVVYGSDEKTTLVTATFPQEQAASLSAALKSCVLSVQPDDGPPADPDADLSFTWTAPEGLKRVTAVSRALIYTKEGKLPATSPAEPLLIVAPSVGVRVLARNKATAERRLRETAEIKSLKIAATEPIAINGLEGFESLASAEDEDSGTPLAVYQALLFTDEGYLLVQGLVGEKLKGEHLGQFKALARSLKLKAP